MIRLSTRDGHSLDAYLARPAARPRGGLVIAQEMYGVNSYLRSVCDFYAAQGYMAIAPALYDRRERNLTYTYTKADHDRAQRTYTA
jgi:carboxymethylenebutenolidase